MSTGLRALKLALLGRTAERQGERLRSAGAYSPISSTATWPSSAGPRSSARATTASSRSAASGRSPGSSRSTRGAEAAASLCAERRVGAARQPARPGGRPHRGFARLPFLRRGRHRAPSTGPLVAGPEWRPSGRGSPWPSAPSPGWLTRPDAACRWAIPTESVLTRDSAGLRRWPHVRWAAPGRRPGRLRRGANRRRPSRSLARPWLFLTASHRLEAHKHSDCLSLIWQERGESLSVDSGKYGYERDRMRGYFLSTRAHNTVEVDSRDFSRANGRRLRQRACAGSSPSRRPGSSRPRRATAVKACATAGSCSSGRTASCSPRPPRARPGHAAGERPRCARLAPRRFTAWWHFDPAHTVEVEAGPDGRHGSPASPAGGGSSFRMWRTAPSPRVELQRGAGGAAPPGLGLAEPTGSLSRRRRSASPRASGGDFFAATLFELARARRGPAWRSPDPAGRRRAHRRPVRATGRAAPSPSGSSPSTSRRGFSRWR